MVELELFLLGPEEDDFCEALAEECEAGDEVACELEDLFCPDEEE